MITREQLAAARGLAGAVQLFAALGYDVNLRRVDPPAWSTTGIVIPTGVFHHGCRVGPVDIFFLEADPTAARNACTEFLQTYRKWNVLARPIVVCVDNACLAIHGSDGTGHVRRLEGTTDRPTLDVLDRLNLLARRDGEPGWDAERQFERALERESITKVFFERFRVAVDRFSVELSAQCNENHEAISDEALLILSRILFLYFLQQKGWLDGNRGFITDHLSNSIQEGRSFFDSVLRPLFFGCLNTPVSLRDESSLRLGDIPYLNGGLFEPSRFEQRHPGITFSNHLLEQVIEETFERYTFCVDEGDEDGVHIDPEMLGKVFENLMAVEERLSTGSFYTPRPIVDALAERAIFHWCVADDSSLVERLSGDLDSATATSILARLEGIRVIDPACGSGAFLLAALHVIERLLKRLSLLAGRPVEPNLRQRIVERSLFGVDLKPEAVRLCELRLWLSIVSSTDATPESVEPLPNLDRNILQGNALLGPLDFLAGTARAEVYQRWSYALRARHDLMDRYRHASPVEKPSLCRAIRESDQSLAVALLGSALKADREELERVTTPCNGLFGSMRNPEEELRAVLEARIAANERHLSRAQDGRIDFFAFDLHFAHVFAGGGFGVVLGNPPWVRSARIEPLMRRMLAERYELFQSGRGFDQSDLCLAFWEKAFDLAADGGVIAMLLPSKIATATYATAMRRKAVEGMQLVALEDWTGQDSFDADIFPLALTTRKARPSGENRIAVTSDSAQFTVPQDRISSDGAGSPWRLVAPPVLETIERIKKRFPAFEEAVGRRPVMGIKTGSNEQFFVEELRFLGGTISVPSLDLRIPREAVARCVRGRDVERWKVNGAVWMLLPPAKGSRKPPWAGRVAAALGMNSDEFRLAYIQPEHFGNKVVWKDVSRGLQAVVLPTTTTVCGAEFPIVPNQTLYVLEALSLQEAHLLATMLNSTVFNALVAAVADRAKDFHYRYFGNTIAGVPCPPLHLNSDVARHLASLSRRAHRGHHVRNEIDEAVRRLYRITNTEFRILSEFLSRRLGLP